VCSCVKPVCVWGATHPSLCAQRVPPSQNISSAAVYIQTTPNARGLESLRESNYMCACVLLTNTSFTAATHHTLAQEICRQWPRAHHQKINKYRSAPHNYIKIDITQRFNIVHLPPFKHSPSHSINHQLPSLFSLCQLIHRIRQNSPYVDETDNMAHRAVYVVLAAALLAGVCEPGAGAFGLSARVCVYVRACVPPPSHVRPQKNRCRGHKVSKSVHKPTPTTSSSHHPLHVRPPPPPNQQPPPPRQTPRALPRPHRPRQRPSARPAPR
jgi:hypothetical protein